MDNSGAEIIDAEIIDVWAQLPTERFGRQKWLETLLRWTGQSHPAPAIGAPHIIAAMDEAGVSSALIAGWSSPEGDLISNDETAAAMDAAPGRLYGVMGAGLDDPMAAVREIRERSKDRRFVGVRVVPWLWGLPPNDRRYYPIYAACIDAGLPFCTQIGHTGPLKSSETGRPIPYLENVLLDFPELVVVGGHVGFPWLDEVASLARKFPNFHVDTSAYALHRLPPAFVEWMKGEGKKRVMFGTNFPMLTPAQCLKGLDALGLDEATRDLFLAGNAKRVFRLG